MSTDENVAQRPTRTGGLAEPAGRDDIVSFVANDLDTTKHDANLIVESVSKAILELARRHVHVRVPNLGNFRVIETKPREGRNPRTGDPVDISAGRRVSFRAAKGFKDLVNRKVS